MNRVYLNCNRIGKVESSQDSKTKSENLSVSDSIFSSKNSNASDDSQIKVIAHRGDSDEAPENTIPAYELAAKNGYEYAECDISWTKDEIPVLLHDDTINRTANIQAFLTSLFSFLGIKSSKTTYEDLLGYDFGSWFDEKYKDTKIPTFQEVLKCAYDNNLNLYVELKKTKNFDSEKAKQLVEYAKKENMLDNITWISFEYDSLKEIRNILPEARLGYLVKKEITDTTIENLNNLKTEKNEVFLDIKSSEITQEGIDKLKSSGFKFETWTVNNIEKVKELDKIGCSGYTTNVLRKDEVERALNR